MLKSNPIYSIITVGISLLHLNVAWATKPNIIFFLVDDMGWQDTSEPFHTETTPLNQRYRTPNMERLADAGMKFTQAYACALCSPTRISLMTGLNAARHRVTNWTLRPNASPDPAHASLRLPLWNVNGLSPVPGVSRTVYAKTLPMYLQKAGYRTIHAGKAHFGADGMPGEMPEALGFDVNIAGHCAGGPGSYYGTNNFSAAFRKGDRIWDVPGLDQYHGKDIYINDALTIEALKAVDQALADNTPFYLYMSHYAIHAPWEKDKRYYQKYKDAGLNDWNATYASMLESMDKSLGDIWDHVKQKGIDDNTIILFMTDNGQPSQATRNLPLRGHKITPYEGGIRVPLMVKWPGVVKPNSVCNDYVIIEDLFPTILEMAGVTGYTQIGGNIDGVSFVSLLRQETGTSPNRAIYWHFPNCYGNPPYSTIRKGDWKLIYFHADQRYELYNLKDDIGEVNNLLEQRKDIAKRLIRQLRRFLIDAKAQMPSYKSTGKPLPLPGTLAGETPGDAAESILPVPSTGQYEWMEQERLMFVCLDPATWQGREYDDHSTDLADMTLPKLDTDQWCQAARAWGAKEILFVAKHTGGFCWWRTETSEYSVKNIAWKQGRGCLLDELARSCAKYKLNLGIYVYPGDDTWGAGIGSGGATKDPTKQEAYNRVFRQQLRETARIAQRHVKVVEFWFDGSCIIDVGDIMQEEAPDAVVFQGPYASVRWVGTERGSMNYDQSWCTVMRKALKTGVSTSFHSTPDGDAWAPCEVNTTLYDHHWFWAQAKESKRKSLDELMRVYYESVGQGTVMLLNSTPNTSGLIPEADMKLYRALGHEIRRRFDRPIAETWGRGNEHLLDLGDRTKVNHVIVREDYRQGERVRQYLVEGWDGNKWTFITGGKHVGRMHINFFDEVSVSKLRLTITESVGEPLIRSFAAYHVIDFKQPAITQHRPWAAGSDQLDKIHKALQANWRLCAKWSKNDFRSGAAELQIDLTHKITEAGQWQVKFIPSDDQTKLSFAHPVLLQQGQASVPGVLTQSQDDPVLWNINRTAVVTEGSEDIQFNVTIRGTAVSGEVFIRRR